MMQKQKRKRKHKIYINMIKGSPFGPWYIFASLTNSSRAQMYIGFVVSSLPNKFLFFMYKYFSLLRFPIKSLYFESSTYILLSSTQHKIFNFFLVLVAHPIPLEHKEGDIPSKFGYWSNLFLFKTKTMKIEEITLKIQYPLSKLSHSYMCMLDVWITI